MKHHRYILLILLFCAIGLAAFAQTKVTIDDQNPRYRESLEKYMDIKDELLANQGETVQNQYKAIQYWYDRYNAKQKWKAEKKEFRKQLRLERARRPRVYGAGFGNGIYGNRNRYNRYNYFRFQPYANPFGRYFYDGNRWRSQYGLNFGLFNW